MLADLGKFYENSGGCEGSHNTTHKESQDEPMTFVELLKKAEQELYPGCSEFSTLSFIVNLLHLKVYNKWSNKSFDMMLKLLKKALPNGETLPKSYYDAKKVLNDLGLGYIAIRACKYDCAIFWKEYENFEECPVCGTSRWKVNNKGKKIPHKVLRYFSLKPRLQRLFMSSKIAEDMRWHQDKRINDEKELKHPTDAKVWKEFDKVKSVRGPTRGIVLRKLNKKNKDKLIIHIDPVQRRPIDSVESAKLSSELGQLSRESLPVPNKWKNFKKTELMTAFTQLDERCNINKQNRSKMTTNRNQGSRSFVVARHMLSQEPEFEGDEVDRIKFHKHTHYTEGKEWITPQSENNHVEMEKRRIDAETRGEVVDVDKIVDDVLGKRSSYIVGLGYGPKPNKSSSGMRILQETLKEKDRECAELKEERAALMEEMNAMKSTLAEHTRLFEKLVQSQNLSSPW
ncbi:hypothetical protein BUALT_Bualt05G0151800 [Buddleja alternifolia]|uniref:Transposase n=1 Tax=Buddleja alternifolia TaxID=168488 RepID=A0AAV6XJE4_9LAMI|nr:hypothetical protein BUALT_Bualt05G0151800 [Buddleja alternifolia]